MVSLLVWLSGVRGVSSRGRGCISGAAGTPRNKPKGVPCVKRVGAREEGCALLAAGSGRLYPQDTVFARGYSKREGAPLAERGVRGGMEGCGVLGSRVAGLQDGWEQGARPTKPGSVWHGEQRAVVNGAGGPLPFRTCARALGSGSNPGTFLRGLSGREIRWSCGQQGHRGGRVPCTSFPPASVSPSRHEDTLFQNKIQETDLLGKVRRSQEVAILFTAPPTPALFILLVTVEPSFRQTPKR